MEFVLVFEVEEFEMTDDAAEVVFYRCSSCCSTCC